MWGFAALAPIIDVRRTALILRWRRTARRLTAHAHRCVKLKQGQACDKARRAPSLVFLCVLDGIVLSIEGLQDYWHTTGISDKLIGSLHM